MLTDDISEELGAVNPLLVGDFFPKKWIPCQDGSELDDPYQEEIYSLLKKGGNRDKNKISVLFQ